MAVWKIFISVGTESEFEMLNKRSFTSRRKAELFCKSNPLGKHYPLHCVMTEEEFWENYNNNHK